MTDLVSATFVTVFLVTVLAQAMPLILAATGETIGEQAGVLNLGIEGVMLIGAYAGFVATLVTGNFWLGMLAGAVGGVVANLAMLILNVWLGLNQIVIGLAVTLVGEGLTSVLYLQNYAKTTTGLGKPPALAIPGLSEIPVIGPAVFRQSEVFWIMLLLVIAMGFLLTRTNWGLSTRAAGQKPSSLDAAGGSVMKTRSQAVILNGVFVGLGGAYLAILTTSTFTPMITNGLGFIAIVITMLSRGRMSLVIITSLIYGLAVAIGPALQVIGFNVPADFIKMLPFVVVMITLIVFARSSVVPPALGAAYTRGAR
ncbi:MULTISPECIES: ABC transporter permease [unclassified Microbacterium]|uniref:ABC transporter permease n=1 Tax=unclassified Microbacterium TaxID=2609290 RepID=UPI001604DC94|nr:MULTISPECIES: ABC transporter permease [unclassified Microbacterium]QNA91454.1 ABC transporter permease [Microbacterium sp. Se63.02b]QYM64626.1 ABC transporter permease [Microbacterium sp. Se5.02b]